MKIILKDRFQQPWYLYNLKIASSELARFLKNWSLNLVPTLSFAVLSSIILLFIINFEKISKTKQTFDYSISFYFKSELTEDEVSEFSTRIAKFFRPTHLTYYSKKDTLGELYNFLDLQAPTSPEVLDLIPSYIKVSYPENAHIDVEKIEKEFATDKDLEKILVSGKYLEKLKNLSKSIVYLFLTITSLLLGSIILNYISSIKLFFLTESKKLSLYYLIGTQLRFIKIPVCYRAFWQGFFGSIFGVFICVFLSNSISDILSEFTNLTFERVLFTELFTSKFLILVIDIVGCSSFSFLLASYLMGYFYKKYQYYYW